MAATIKQGAIYAYDKIHYLSITNEIPANLDFDTPVDGQDVDVTAMELLGRYVTELTESPNAVTSEDAFIINKTASTTVDSYNIVFAGNTLKVVSDKATKAIIDVPYFLKTGEEAMLNLLIVDEYNSPQEGFYTARMFRVSVSVSSENVTATEKIDVDFELAAAKDPVFGVYEKDTKTFTISKTQTVPTP